MHVMYVQGKESNVSKRMVKKYIKWKKKKTSKKKTKDKVLLRGDLKRFEWANEGKGAVHRKLYKLREAVKLHKCTW